MYKSFLIVLCFLTLTTNAQISQGNILAGGAVSFTSQKYSGGGSNANVLHIMPDAGYFFADKIAGGIRASFTDYSDAGDSYRDLLIGPFARYYFLPVAQKTNIFLEEVLQPVSRNTMALMQKANRSLVFRPDPLFPEPACGGGSNTELEFTQIQR